MQAREQVLEDRIPAPSDSGQLPMAKRLAKAYMELLGTIAPTAAGRRAADVFGYTRTFSKKREKDIAPLGARAFPVQGDAGITKGYQWGKPGATVLLVHGWGSESSTMLPFVRQLVDAGFRAATFDAPEHGTLPGSISTMMRFNNAVRDVIVSLGDVVAVVAHSIGAITSTGAIRDLTGRHRIQAMCLLAPPANLPLVIDRWAADDFRALSDNVVNQMKAELWRRNGVPVHHWDTVALAKDMGIPTLIMHDPADPIVPIRDAEIIAESLSQATLEKMPAAGQHLRILSDARVIERTCRFVVEHAHAQTAAAT